MSLAFPAIGAQIVRKRLIREWFRGIYRLWKIAQDRRIRRHSKGMGRVDSAWRRHP